MSTDNTTNNKRIAKNTILLYIRTLFIMLISLYTSRIILNQLGVEDYGIYNAVGGVVAMFSVISSALSSSISRFITFELGHGDKSRLSMIFSTSVNIEFIIATIVLVLCELVGVWFLNTKMSIPDGRMTAANWVLQCSLLSFCIGLISVPYNACIIAHERMGTFAYISIFEAVLKLLICYALIISNGDRLIVYAVLMLAVSVVVRIIYGIYCSRNFSECRYKWVYNKPLLHEMTGFAGWSFLTNISWIFNTQGVNLLVNVFFGVVLNAARGIASQVEGAVMQFVNSFTTAINPQITKSYAAGEKDSMFVLICRGAKFSLLLLFLLVIPLEFEADYVLWLWLKNVPDHAVIFSRLALIGIMINAIGNTGLTACMATGNIKKYVLYITSIGVLVFPLTWLAYYVGMPAEFTYYIFILVYIVIDVVRLFIMRSLLDFPIVMFVKESILPLAKTLLIGVIPLLFIYLFMEQSLLRLIIVFVISFISIGVAGYFHALTNHERSVLYNKFINISKLK